MSTILIVEDDKNTRAGLTEILRDEGYQVENAENGSTALQIIDSGIDLLLSDLKLPDFSGLDLYKKVKSKHPELKSVIMTAYSTQDVCREGRELGVFSWLTKPLNIDDLLIVLKEALKPASEKGN